ncbi:hypothetical protein Y032_0004g1750 [Ancylostoma ceylanicum]|uniref:SCP domain-containing protein n=1 Tax=Ancylostoma ceylanicum TaxID=53326 RepID=A0A016VTK9_9BILA|nr:hypothetical protein Y032_0004g1750 [Ancylostoma ceylanicum]
MVKPYFIALAIASLFAALCDGKPVVFARPLCEPNGQLDKKTIDDGILAPVNARREALAQGTQKNGDTNTKLPPATSMTKLGWDCDLEKKAIEALGDKCADPGTAKPPANPDMLADIFYPGYDFGGTAEEIFKDAFNGYLSEIDVNNGLPVRTQGTVISNPIYNGDPLLLNYANLVRPTNTKIGCAMQRCPSDLGDLLTYYCVMDGKTITKDEPVYQGTTSSAGCTEITCPVNYVCNETTWLCEAPTATTAPATTTMSTATSTPSSSASSSSTPSSTSAPAATTTIPTSPQAEFPQGGGGGMCSTSHNYAGRMTDALRNEYVRGLLAKGEIPRKDGKYLPKAANMWRMSYDCDLEAGAIQHASTCPSALSEPSSRPGIGENLKTFPAPRFTFDTAAKKSVTEWWKPIRDVNYFENVVVFRPIHDGQPISSFTQMGWALTNKLGCSIVKCRTDDRYVGVCRYRPNGNIVNSNVYQVGNICTMNPGGASGCDADGLWF